MRLDLTIDDLTALYVKPGIMEARCGISAHLRATAMLPGDDVLINADTAVGKLASTK